MRESGLIAESSTKHYATKPNGFSQPPRSTASDTGNFLSLLMWWKNSARHYTGEGAHYCDYEHDGDAAWSEVQQLKAIKEP